MFCIRLGSYSYQVLVIRYIWLPNAPLNVQNGGHPEEDNVIWGKENRNYFGEIRICVGCCLFDEFHTRHASDFSCIMKMLAFHQQMESNLHYSLVYYRLLEMRTLCIADYTLVQIFSPQINADANQHWINRTLMQFFSNRITFFSNHKTFFLWGLKKVTEL